jgi:hypothetical protein
MRRELKRISDELTQQIKKKRFIPKKKMEDEDTEAEDRSQVNGSSFSI